MHPGAGQIAGNWPAETPRAPGDDGDFAREAGAILKITHDNNPSRDCVIAGQSPIGATVSIKISPRCPPPGLANFDLRL